MSMTREEAIVQIQELKEYCEDMADSDESGAYVFDLDVQAIDLAITALSGPTREMVERMRGEWETPGYYDDGGHFVHDCSKCGAPSNDEYPFCPACGAPMTDEAVQMVMDRMVELQNEIG